MTKIESFIKRNERRNKHLWESDKLLGYDYIICPVTNTRLSMIKKSYIEKVLGITVDNFNKKYPNQQKTCRKRIENIKKGLKIIDKETGLTKHQLSIANNPNRTYTGLTFKDGKNEYLKKYRRLNAFYNSYAKKIDWCEEVRENSDGYLEVRCDYCGKWFIPTNMEVQNRMSATQNVNGGEKRFYCSKECKSLCPIFNQQYYYKGKENKNVREVQPQVRHLVLERDGYTCQKCGSIEYLHCHHIYPVATNPLESADIDNCITLCKNCHKKVHQKDGCKYRELLSVC